MDIPQTLYLEPNICICCAQPCDKLFSTDDMEDPERTDKEIQIIPMLNGKYPLYGQLTGNGPRLEEIGSLWIQHTNSEYLEVASKYPIVRGHCELCMTFQVKKRSKFPEGHTASYDGFSLRLFKDGRRFWRDIVKKLSNKKSILDSNFKFTLCLGEQKIYWEVCQYLMYRVSSFGCTISLHRFYTRERF